MPFSKSNLVVIVLGIIAAVLFFLHAPTYLPQASANLERTRPEIISIARQFLDEIGYEQSSLTADANFRFGSSTALYLQIEEGLVKSNELLKQDSTYAHEWHVYLFDRSKAPSQMRHRYNLWLSPNGTVRGFQHILPDSVSIPSILESEALTLAESFLRRVNIDLEAFTLQRSTVNTLPERMDYFFSWQAKETVQGMDSKVWVRVQGDKIGGFRAELDVPESFEQAGSGIATVVQFIVTAASIAIFLLVIFVISIFLKKYHEGEVGTKTAWIVFTAFMIAVLLEGVLVFTTSGYNIGMGDVNRANVRIITYVITFFIVHAFLGAMVFAGWSVAESSARSGWSAKLKSIDGLLYGKPFTLEFGKAVVMGYAYGFLLLALMVGGLAFFSSFGNFGIFVLGLGALPESMLPGLGAVLLAFRIAILNEIVFRFFFVAWLREKTKRIWPGILVSSLIWTLIAFNLWDAPVGYIDLKALFPLYFLTSVILGVIMVKHDLLTTICTNFLMLAMAYGIPMFVSPAPFFQSNGILFFGLMFIPLALAGIGFVRRQTFSFSQELIPTHIRRISERERMSKELEIARNVQMSLLPKRNPLITGYDIAGVCIPALEVGGDYYDFFDLGHGKLGVAIGDVSGKGVPAAIYMTLTKGILQSHAGESASPKEVLHKLNKQMYLNIERNSFVSMFYAVLDMKKYVIRFSRAGHNPAILVQRGSNTNSFIQPKGMALGLESGRKFDQALEEHEMPLQSGDVLTFYTDGFTEASNEEGAEYGEERLMDIIANNKGETANIILQRVVRSVKHFVGNHTQHDDMTMVVLKVS